MTFAAFARRARALAAALVMLAAPGMTAFAQSSPSPSVSPTPSPGVAATPTPSPVAPGVAAPTPAPSPSPDSGGVGKSVELVPAPAAYIEGKASRDEVYNAILAAIATIRAEVAKAGLKATGHAKAVFLEADDDGFRYRVLITLESAPEGKALLTDKVKIGQTPAGKAVKFEHRGEYDEIDATYEAITAYLDEKGVDAQDIFMEEYLNEPKTSDDPNLQVDIYVLVK